MRGAAASRLWRPEALQRGTHPVRVVLYAALRCRLPFLTTELAWIRCIVYPCKNSSERVGSPLSSLSPDSATTITKRGIIIPLICFARSLSFLLPVSYTPSASPPPIPSLSHLASSLRPTSLSRASWQVPIHVDAASGGFVAPFLYPEIEWDFRLPRVQSINVSGHK